MRANAWTAGLPARYVRPDGSIDTGKLKAEVSIAEVAAEATDLVQVGTEMRGLCPFHDENTASFFLNDSKGVYFCHGCAAHGDTIDLFSRLRKVDFPEACKALAGAETRPVTIADGKADAAAKAANRARARDEWRTAGPVDGTVAETYLLSRAIGYSVPSTIRFGRTPRYWNDDGSPGPRHSAMIAGAQDADGRIVGIQRTYLDREGRKMRGGSPRLSLGRVRGTALRLGPVMPKIMLASAVEDALSLRLMFPGATVWSAFGDANLQHVEMPRGIWHVTVCGDADESGRAAVAAAREALGRKGIQTGELFPHGGAKDFNEEWVLLHA
ncbi:MULTISPECIES: DUF7146 domain-containing protein [Sphingomonas]|uniref:CHC2 zinc finger domain-containing protein n=1 Tax=Sphingomonas molluscorum TaxID=418184 RepID=A0ABU8Q541_9SPHN|nr:CHC2 zinc finger domain-containing protein [Sphingomonas sp. JUb134]MBM7406383.1 phage/plasmid primase-like uncharacterized protein [Sphingomonas sp. JUb134]